MSALKVLWYPDQRLRTIAAPVTVFDEKLQTIIDDMFETMYIEKGIGLAATQVNIHQQIAVIDIEGDKKNQIVIINPEITSKSGDAGIEEGCLSVPSCRSFVARYKEVSIKALDRHGNPFTLDADGLLAICIQHEVDHLNGMLYLHHLSPLKQQRFRQKVEKIAKQEKRLKN